jgi:hypothetical protein
MRKTESNMSTWREARDARSLALSDTSPRTHLRRPLDLATGFDHGRPESAFEGLDRNRLRGHDPGLDHLRQEGASHTREPGE